MYFNWLPAAGVCFVTAFAQLVCAQSGEAAINYSLVVYNPAKSLSGERLLNGGGGSVGFALGDHLTLKAEFQSYATTTLTYHLPETANSAAGSYESQGTMFTYLFGPQFNLPLGGKRFFGEALFGRANTDAYSNLFHAAHVTGLSASNNGFAMAFGGGLDYKVSRRVGLRPAQFDYFMTRYEWRPLGINNQSNFRYQAGLLFLLGRL